MMKRKAMKLGMLSLSAGLFLAACETDETMTDPSPIEEETTDTDDTEPIEEQPADTEEESDDDTDDTEMTDDTDETNIDDNVNQMETPGIEGIEFPVTLNSSIDIFYETFGSEEINIDSIEFDEEDGRYVYSFDGWDGEYDYELEIDAETSEIIDQEQEEDSDTEDAIDLEGIITPLEAMDAALEASGSGYVEEWELEVEDGQTIYDIDIEDGEDQEIDALTGDVL